MRTRLTAAAVTAAALLCPPLAQAAPERSTTDRLEDRRYVAASERGQIEGFQDGRFYANGWHITGEMGGVWSPPLKLVDGVWFGIDDQWIEPAERFTSGYGYARMEFPETAGLRVRRTDFAPDGRRAALFGLELTNPGAARTVTVKVDAHSELLTSYPWGFSGVMPNASQQLPDRGSFDGNALVFRDDGRLPHPNASEHHHASLVAADREPLSGTTGPGFRGPQGDNVCTAQEPPSECDDGPFGKGVGGQLRYRVAIPAGGTRTLWVAV
ncbi:MAG: glycogen debranching protein, partial [Solirubrobacteraceae bacterium]